MVQHFLKADSLTPEELLRIFRTPKGPDRKFTKELEGVLVALLFFEHSARTESSFESAIKLAGGDVMTPNTQRLLDQGAESVADFIRGLSHQCHCIVLRHGNAQVFEEAVGYSQIPIINGGGGYDEHPIQAYGDMHTIWIALGGDQRIPARIKNKDGKLNLLCWGDNRENLAASSLVTLLASHGPTAGIKLGRVDFYGPVFRRQPNETLTKLLETHGIDYRILNKKPAVSDIDVVYATRHKNGSNVEPAVFTPRLANELPEHAIIMGHMPRSGVVHPDVDTNPRAMYFEQARHGLLVINGLMRHIANHGGFKT